MLASQQHKLHHKEGNRHKYNVHHLLISKMITHLNHFQIYRHLSLMWRKTEHKLYEEKFCSIQIKHCNMQNRGTTNCSHESYKSQKINCKKLAHPLREKDAKTEKKLEKLWHDHQRKQH